MHTEKKHRLLAFAGLFALLGSTCSCVSTKSIIYFQEGTASHRSDSIRQSYTPTIQPNDLLSIVVGSLSPEADALFNVPNQFMTSAMNYNGLSGTQSLGYLVDSEGNIEMPLAGKIHLANLVTQTAADTIRQRLLPFLREPTVTIRSLNFKVSVLGEVSRPAVYVVPDGKITLPEVLGLAGDLTIYGRRDNVSIIREENGIRTYANVDLTSRDIFESPYYYMHKNDLVYVEPVKARLTNTDRTWQILPLVVSVFSTIGFLIVSASR